MGFGFVRQVQAHGTLHATATASPGPSAPGAAGGLCHQPS